MHIIESIERIERYVGQGQSEMIYDAVLRNLQTLCESARRLSDDIKARHPDIPWSRIIGFRNILVHDYLGGIEPNIVWRVVDGELPPLKAALLNELPAWPIPPAIPDP